MKIYTNLFDLANDFSKSITDTIKEKKLDIESISKNDIKDLFNIVENDIIRCNKYVTKHFSENDKIQIVNILVPGYDKSELKVNLINNTFTITGTSKLLNESISTEFITNIDRYELKSTELKNGILTFIFNLKEIKEENTNIEIK